MRRTVCRTLRARSLRRSLAMLAVALAPAGVGAQGTDALYQEACDGGDLIACNVFGLMLETGEGVPQDIERSALLYERACEGGVLVGCTNVGLLHEAGVGLPRDLLLASGFYRVACEGGEQLGCDLLRGLEAGRRAAAGQRHYKAGRVGDAETMRSLDEAIVELPGLGMQTVTTAEGRFVLAGLPAGRHDLRVERLGYDVLESSLEVPGDTSFVILLTPSTEPVEADALGQIEGRVTDAGEQGLVAVDIAIVGDEGARTLSNAQGRFTLRGVEPGLVVVRFARLGYAPRTATLIVQPGRTSEVGVTMVVEPIELEAVEVTVRNRDLERSGFYDRRMSGFGSHLSPQDLERLRPVVLSDAVRRAPGIEVIQNNLGASFAVSRRNVTRNNAECVLPVYVDGVRMIDPDLDLFPADAIAAVEVYQGPGTPVQYLDARECGAVLLWTRRGN